MTHNRTTLALATAGVLLAGSVNAAQLEDATAGFEWVLGPELVGYYLPASQERAMPNPIMPSESDSWGE